MKVEPGRPTVVHVDAPPVFEGHEAYAYIPALVAGVGGDPDAHRGLPRAVVEVGPFFIGRFPVTVREYVDFLEAIRSAQGVEAARAHAPRGPDGTVYLDVQPESGRFEAPSSDRDGDVWQPDWPIMMVSRDDAEAYCAWVSEWTSTPDGEHPDGGVLKGAGYRSQSIWCRSASRVIQRVSFTGVQFGFRVVREPG